MAILNITSFDGIDDLYAVDHNPMMNNTDCVKNTVIYDKIQYKLWVKTLDGDNVNI